MSRAAVLQHLESDQLLKQLAPGGVHPNFTLDTAPSKRKSFLILRWEDAPLRGRMRRGPRVLTVWAHTPYSVSTDYGEIDKILARTRAILEGMEDVPGADGYTVTCVQFTGDGADQKDTGYNTITRNAAFEVLYRPHQ